MTKFSLFLTTVATLAFSGAVFAQETTPAQEDAPAQVTEPAAEPTGEESAQPNADLSVLDTGETVDDPNAPAQPQAPETYVRSTHGDWDVQCLPNENGPEACQMYQLLQDPNGANVAEVSLFRLQNSGQVAAGGTFVVPLETLLTEKLNIQVDSAQAKRYDFSFCTPGGCYSRVGFTAADIAAFRAGNVAKVTIVPFRAPDQKVTVDMSLSGFTAAYDEVTELENQRQQQ